MPHLDSDALRPTGVILDDSLWPASIRWFDLTLPGISQNLALDEVLLANVDEDASQAVLRFWEAPSSCVVLGRSNRAETEVNMEACRADGIPVIRRSSGGGAVVLGPGCLAFSLALPLTDAQRALGVAALTRELMNRMALALRPITPEVIACGTSDLAATSRKFSGNAQRWLSKAFLHHGTILYQFDLPRIGRYLRQPSRQPDYRSGRGHDEFVMNVAASRGSLIELLADAWHATPAECDPLAVDRAQQLSDSKYSSADWSILL
ncbi:MAG: lipoate--protein ligase family protein [Planctomycetota bacterium]